MKALLALAARSAWNRRFVLGLIIASIALSTFLLLGIERLRHDVRENFSSAVSGTDLIVGARTGSVQLLLYSVFRIGQASNNMRWSSVEALAANRAVAWAVPISLGDSHRGFAVVATTPDYFSRFEYGEHQPLRLSQGRAFGAVTPQDTSGVFEAVLGAEVAERLGYRLGQKIVLSHGDGVIADNDHADKPFSVVGVLAPTGTPVDRSVHISLQGMEAIHLDWSVGVPMPGAAVTAAQALQQDLTPKTVTALLIGLKRRAAVFSMQRQVADFRAEPLMAILPGVALDELWDVVGVGERGLQLMSALVSLVSLAGLVAVIMAGLNERRRELAILRSVGAGPWQMLWLLALEGLLITLAGVLLGALALALGLWLGAPLVQQHWGLALSLRPPEPGEWALAGAIVLGGWCASLMPGLRAYRLSLADGLAPRI